MITIYPSLCEKTKLGDKTAFGVFGVFGGVERKCRGSGSTHAGHFRFLTDDQTTTTKPHTQKTPKTLTKTLQSGGLWGIVGKESELNN
jgi:hypothetical protein